MTIEAIDHRTLAELALAGALRAAHVVGKGSGWTLTVEVGATTRQLTATRSREPRAFKSMERLVTYLKSMGISSFDVDARNFDPGATDGYKRPDASVALKETHAAAAHDRWLREQIEAGVREAADPSVQRITNDDVKAAARARRALLRSSGPAVRNRSDR